MNTPPTPSELALLQVLRMQIDDMCSYFDSIRSEVATISQKNRIPDATLHLQDVLKSTEDATLAIIDAAMAIGTAAEESNASAATKHKLQEQVGIILQSCSFQDLSGQHIKKVLAQINNLEAQLLALSKTSAGQVATSKAPDPLLNGPPLSGKAPSQAEIDRQFKAAK